MSIFKTFVALAVLGLLMYYFPQAVGTVLSKSAVGLATAIKLIVHSVGA